MCRSIAMTLFIFLCSSSSWAAETTIDGQKVSCPAAKTIGTTTRPIAEADPMSKTININPATKDKSTEFKMHVFYHECCHLSMKGDPSTANPAERRSEEKRADECASQRAKQEGWLTEQAAKEKICPPLQELPATQEHEPGNMRCLRIQRIAAGGRSDGSDGRNIASENQGVAPDGSNFQGYAGGGAAQ